MADISKITLPSGDSYDLKDAVARQDIADIRSSVTGAMHYIGATTTELTDGSTVSSITIEGESITVKDGDVALYGELEYIFGSNKWHKFGEAGSFKALAFKDSASGDYQPAGTVSQPTFTGSEATITIASTASGTVSQPTFTGTQGSVTVSGTATGSVTMSVGTGTANYTPSGTVSKPTTTVELNTTTVNSIDTVGSLPSCTFPTCSVSGEVLTFTSGSFNAGSLPTKSSNITVATSVKSASTTQPTFSGNGAELIGTFSGTSFTSTGTYTPEGTVSQPTFTGEETSGSVTYTPIGTVSQPTFTGTQDTITVS